MKLNFVVHSLDVVNTGGVSKVVINLCNLFCKQKDVQVSIYHLGKLNQLAFPLDEKVKIITLDMEKHSTSQYQSLSRIQWFWESYRAFNEIIKDKKEIWLPISPPLNMLFCLLKTKYKSMNIIGCDHTSTIYSKGLFIDTLKYHILKKMDYMVALTPEDMQYYKSKGINSVTIPNFITETTSQKENLRKYIIFVGRFSEEKQPLLALKIYHQSKLYEKNIEFKMFGQGEDLTLLNAYIEEHHLTPYVEIISGETNYYKIYDNACALILTSKIEGFAMVLLEAITNNIPCIAFNAPNGPRNIIQHGKNGFLVEPYDIEQFVNYLKSKELVSLHNVDISNTVKKFSQENILKLWLNILR